MPRVADKSMDASPVFSLQVKATTSDPAARHSRETSKGATGPHASRTKEATTPDPMATMPLPVVHSEKVRPSHSSG